MSRVPPKQHVGHVRQDQRVSSRPSVTDVPQKLETDDDTGVGFDRGSAAGTPGWVTVLVVVVAVGLVVMFVFLHLSGAVGPGAH